MDIIFATANQNKLTEARSILEESFSIITPKDKDILEDIPEDADTIEGNAVMKAMYVWNRTCMPCFADDTGLEVEALNGAPGVHSARYASPVCNSAENIRKLLWNLRGYNNRKARFITVIVLIINGETRLFKGTLNGVIIDSPRGEGGFGYDSVFVPAGYDKTLAELTANEKNIISHRGKALRKLATFLKENI